MENLEISINISKSIKENKWLDIKYKNSNNEITYFWVSIIDVNPAKKSFSVDIYNDTKSPRCKSATIYLERILSARVLQFTSTANKDSLIEKIENNLLKYSFLKYDTFSKNVLYYLKDCYEHDSDPYLNMSTMIPGIDVNTLVKNSKLKLNEEQHKIVINLIKNSSPSYDNNYNNYINSLAISSISIEKDSKIYVFAYRKLSYNPKYKTLFLGKELNFNKTFMVKDSVCSIYDYLDMELDNFIELAKKDLFAAREYLKANVKKGELVSSRPNIFIQQWDCNLNLDELFTNIENDYKNNQLKAPLKSFFGLLSVKNYASKKSDLNICLLNKYINIDQMRVIYNTIKYPITYVQGPPGTGKTSTIINVIFSMLFNDKTVLVSSNNNTPVNGIKDKLYYTYKDKKYEINFLRLGNNEDTYKAVCKIISIYDSFENNKEMYDVKYNISKIEDYKRENSQNNKVLLEKIKIHERKLQLQETIKNLKKIISISKKDDNNIKKLSLQLINLENEEKQLSSICNSELTKLYTCVENSLDLQEYFNYLKISKLLLLKNNEFNDLKKLKYITDPNQRVTLFNKFIQDDKNLKNLLKVFPVILTTNISSKKLGTYKTKFDLLIMDEAGQCCITPSLIPLSKCNSLLLVGDPNQLKPVILLDKVIDEEYKRIYKVSDNYDYNELSILECMRKNDQISKYILLRYHYRCAKKIINFSNKRYYHSLLLTDFIKNDGEVTLLNVKNTNVQERNTALDEALSIINYIKKNNIKDASIITPFRNQRDLLQSLIMENNLEDEIDVGTIHSYQGSEKSTIFISTALSYKTHQNTYTWLKNNKQLINVGTTRAKDRLIIANDTSTQQRLSNKDDDLYYLVKYAYEKGTKIVNIPENPQVEIGYSNGSVFENEFFKTISQYVTTNKKLEVSRNVLVKDLFPRDSMLQKSNQEFDCVLYAKTLFNKTPLIAFEINGSEHIGNALRENLDNRKRKIAKEKGLKIITIPNDFVKSYDELIQILKITLNKKEYEQLSLFD